MWIDIDECLQKKKGYNFLKNCTTHTYEQCVCNKDYKKKCIILSSFIYFDI